MKLTVFERLVTLGILPKEGDFATLKILTGLKLALSFTEEEVKEWGITTDKANGTTSWATNEETEIPIGEKATDIIVAALKDLSKQKKMTEQHISLYEKFVPTDDK